MLNNETKLQSNEIESGIKQWNLNTYMVFLGWSHFSLCIKTPLEKGKLGVDINKMVKGIGNVNYDQVCKGLHSAQNTIYVIDHMSTY